MQNHLSSATSRRRFLGTALGSAASLNLLSGFVKGQGTAANGKLNLAFIGAGGRAGGNLDGCAATGQTIYALCDVDKGRADGAFKKFPGAKVYTDWREMLETEGDKIDAVVVSTPDHLHAVSTMAALKMGKHVYVEKPLTLTISEARALHAAAKKAGVCTQMGNTGHASEGSRLTNEAIQSGSIGEVGEVHCRTNRPIWPQDLVRPAGEPVPDTLNWDLWLGPAAERAYHPAYHPFSWRDFWAFGSSHLGDFGTHDMNSAVRALDLYEPSLVEGYGVGFSNAEIAPYGSLVHYHFPATAKRQAIKLTWYSGGMRPAQPEALGAVTHPNRGSLYVGDKGVIQTDGNGGAPRLFPAERRAAFVKPEPRLKRSNGHHRDWIDACKGGEPASCPFDYGAQLTEIVLLGVLSQRLQKPIRWDAANMKATGLEAADPLIKAPRRAGWELV